MKSSPQCLDGQFLSTPAGAHERLIEAAGFIELNVENVTDTITAVSKRRYDAREKHRNELVKIESASDFENLQNMLAAAHTLSSERRLSRFAHSARNPARSSESSAAASLSVM